MNPRDEIRKKYPPSYVKNANSLSKPSHQKAKRANSSRSEKSFSESYIEVIEGLNNEKKRLLWGIIKNRERIEKMTEITIEKLTNVLKMKKDGAVVQTKNTEKKHKSKSSESRNIPTAEIQRAKSLDKKETSYLKRELNTLMKIKEILKKSDNTRFVEQRVSTIAKRRKDQAGQTQRKSTERETEQGKQYKILIIEDEAIIVKTVCYFLEQEDYIVRYSLDPEEGLKMALEEKPDLILLDLMMPGLHGYQIISMIKSNKKTADIPVVILSSLSRETDILEGLERGAADYITKPFSPQILVTKIKKILG